MNEQAPSKEQVGPFVVADGGSTGENRFRTMNQGMSAWTLDIDEALQFARRKDAETFAAEDEDAWQILPVPRTAHEPPAVPAAITLELLNDLHALCAKVAFLTGSLPPSSEIAERTAQPPLLAPHCEGGGCWLERHKSTALLVRQAFLPANPNKLRNARPDVVQAAKDFIALAERPTSTKGESQ